MHRALRYLLLLQYRAAVRKRLARAKGVRGAMMTLLGVGALFLWIFPSLMLGKDASPADPATVYMVMPTALMLMCVLQLASPANDRVIYFSPGEVDLLFAGPFTRRSLLLYRLAITLPGLAFGGFLFSLFFVRFASFWLAAFVALFLAMTFIHLIAMVFCLVTLIVGEHATTRARKTVGLVCIVLVALGAVQGFSSSADMGSMEFLKTVSGSWALKYALLPFAPFARTFASTALFPDFVVWAGVSLAANAALFLVVIKLDANYLETAANVSQKVYQRMQRVRRAGIASSRETTSGRMLPMAPRMWGMGPILWRQTVNAMRCSRNLMIMLAIICVAIIPVYVMRGAGGGGADAAMASLLLWLTIMLSLSLRYDFRGELECMDMLKTLPLKPMAVAAGELLAPTILTTVVQTILLTLLVVAIGGSRLAFLALLAAPPVNMILFGVENAMFLLYPTTQVGTAMDFQFMGGHMIRMLLKVIVVALSLAIAAGVGFLTYLVSGESLVISGMAAWLTLAAEALAMLPLVARAYKNFDPSSAPSA